MAATRAPLATLTLCRARLSVLSCNARSLVPAPGGLRPYTSNKSAGRTPFRRLVPADAQTWMRADGQITTTPETREFLVQNGIHLDNGLVKSFSRGAAAVGAVAKQFGVTVGYSPWHIVNPIHVKYFGPFDHPLAPWKRDFYRRKRRDEPLWVMVSVLDTTHKAVVRITLTRRLKAAVYRALRERGLATRYSTAAGSADAAADAQVTGTVWIRVHDQIKAVNQDAMLLGRATAEALLRETEQGTRPYSRPRREGPKARATGQSRGAS